MTSPHLTVRFDGTVPGLYSLRPWNAQLVLLSIEGQPNRLRIMREGEEDQTVEIGDAVTKDAEGRLCKVGKAASA